MEAKSLAKIILYRILFGLVSFAFIIHGFWIGAHILGILVYWRIPYYFELILFGLMYDALYGHYDRSVYSYAGIVTAILVSVILTGLKSVVRRRK